MQYIFRHGLMLTLANFLGSILFVMLYLVAYVFIALVAFAFLAILGISTGGLEDPFANIGDESVGVVAGLTMILFYLVYFLLILLFNSLMLGGAYGSSIEAVFDNRSSLGTYFTAAFRYFWRLTGVQLVILLLSLPLILILIIPLVIFETMGMSDNGGIILIWLLFAFVGSIIPWMLYLHAPILVIKENVGAWKSVSLSFRLCRKAFGTVLASSLAYMLTYLAILAVFVILLIILLLPFGLTLSELDSDAVSGVAVLLAVLLILIYYFIGMPFSYASAHLVVVDRYKRLLRPLILPPTPGTDGSGGEPTFSYQPKESFQPGFTYHAPGNGNQTQP